MQQRAEELLEFWFSEQVKPHWFNSTAELDQQIRDKYERLWNDVQTQKLDAWLHTPQSSLALVILLDQMPLNMFRNQAKSFATEQMAINATKQIIAKGMDQSIPLSQRAFIYMPLMHSENIEDQNLSVERFKQPGLEANYRFAKHHQNIIEQFGRFPHRNAILGRQSSPKEREYLSSKNAFTG